MDADIIYRYFPGLGPLQRERFEALAQLYSEWNARINVISRKDGQQLYLRHVLHSLALVKVVAFSAGARILDVGTGGGFPGIPLAIMFPEAQFTLVDSIGKKIKVVEGITGQLGLDNVQAVNTRAEVVPGKFDYVVSRAVTALPYLIGWVWNKIEKGQAGSLPNGMFCLKGGDLGEEIAAAGKKAEVYEIGNFFGEEFFETKKVIYLPR
ncbi:MAG: 16S rRNA (guanine(527)-N(7))-methyltransferase RsmG [Rikenellaceae bacterium]|nr:16S rRNA (guanine(527)-N(7))-methyltransferase RsmG [Rikenellaceae bacterium]